MWKDEFLTWKPEDYGGIRTISMPPSYIWTPDIELFNRHNDFTMISPGTYTLSINNMCFVSRPW